MTDSAMPPPPPPIEPGEPFTSAARPAQQLPWEQPGQPFIEALFETVKLFIMRPGEAFSRMQKTGDLMRPVLYAIILGWIGILFAQIFSIALSGFQADMMKNLGGNAAMGMGMSTTMSLGVIVLAPVFILIGLAIQTAVLHLALMIVGGANRGFDTTFRTCCYAYTSQLAGIVPLCGGLIGLVWWIVLTIIGLATAHDTTQGKSALAVILPVVLCCVCGIVLAVIFGASLAGLASQYQ